MWAQPRKRWEPQSSRTRQAREEQPGPRAGYGIGRGYWSSCWLLVASPRLLSRGSRSGHRASLWMAPEVGILQFDESIAPGEARAIEECPRPALRRALLVCPRPGVIAWIGRDGGA